MEYEEVATNMEGLVRGYFNIVANTLLDAGYHHVSAKNLKNTVWKARELFKPEYHAVFDAVFAEMVEDIEELNARGFN